jgi:hypothetical protein
MRKYLLTMIKKEKLNNILINITKSRKYDMVHPVIINSNCDIGMRDMVAKPYWS